MSIRFSSYHDSITLIWIKLESDSLPLTVNVDVLFRLRCKIYGIILERLLSIHRAVDQ